MKTGRFLQKELIYSTLEIFYSRRIGEHPSTYPDVAANEEVTNYPSSVINQCRKSIWKN
jgi:hypothetical protein